MSKIWNTALENNPNQLMQLEFLPQHPVNDPYDLLLNLLSTYYWLTCGRCKKSPTTNKETLLNGNKFYMTAFNTRFECPKVALECHYLAFCTVGFQSWLNWKMKCRMQYKAIENCSNFPVVVVTGTDDWLIKVLILNIQLLQWLKSFSKASTSL